jgi:hypothetical protein
MNELNQEVVEPVIRDVDPEDGFYSKPARRAVLSVK